jgi:hypothetical protein
MRMVVCKECAAATARAAEQTTAKRKTKGYRRAAIALFIYAFGVTVGIDDMGVTI